MMKTKNLLFTFIASLGLSFVTVAQTGFVPSNSFYNYYAFKNNTWTSSNKPESDVTTQRTGNNSLTFSFGYVYSYIVINHSKSDSTPVIPAIQELNKFDNNGLPIYDFGKDTRINDNLLK